MADYREDYMYGSEAPQRRYDDEPVRVPRKRVPFTKEERRKQQAQMYAAENRRKASRFGGLYTALITVAVAATLFTCVNYITLINNKSDNSKQITELQNQLSDIKAANDQTQLTIDTSVDYDYIYNVATEKLGMVYASPDQIIMYHSGESEYVIQYSNIPEN